jgi:hypothetical protein
MPTFVNHGGPQLVVELGREVQKGETFKGSDALAAVHGFALVEKPAKGKDDKPADEE